jgi:hypothetical protein
MHQDFKELLAAFNAEQVKYLIVGGYAVSFHAQPRATKDLDILIGVDAGNSRAVYAALAKFGAPIEGLSAKDFAEPDNFFRMGTPPVMVDIMPKISGVEFDKAWSRRVDVQIDDGLSVPFISREDLLSAKLSAGRAQDLVDVDALRESNQSQEIEQQQSISSSRNTRSVTLEEMRAKSRENWLKFRQQQTREGSRGPDERSAGEDELDKGLDDDLI